MHLYQINPSDGQLIHVVARTHDEAAELFITWSVASGVAHEGFSIDLLPIKGLIPEQQAQVRRAFAAGLIGISHFDEDIGWTFSPPMWLPLGPDEQPECGNVEGQS